MKNSFVNNAEDVFSANQAQVKKIQYLTREKIKMDAYIKDLQQSLQLNKEAVRNLNREGPNNKTIEYLNQQNKKLFEKLQASYQQNRDLNAIRLFEGQIRLQDKNFYNERVSEFQSRISDLRKYLHDKEDSFTNVVNRLRKYEDINELTIQQKLSEFKNQFGQSISQDIVTALAKERNYYKKKFEQAQIAVKKLIFVEQALTKDYTIQRFKQQFQKMNEQMQTNLQQLIENTTNSSNSQNEAKIANLNPNKQLIRLLKKQKLSNQLLQETLNDAIDKNEELLNINEKLSDANNNLEQTCKQLRSQLMVLQGYLSQFEQNYRIKNEKYHSKCDMYRPGYKYSDFSNDITGKDMLKKLKKDVDRMANFISCGAKQRPGKNLSTPKRTINYNFGQDSIQIEEI